MRTTAVLFLFSFLLPSGAQQKVATPMAAQVRPIPDEAVRQNARLAVSLSTSAKAKIRSAAAALAVEAKEQPAMTAAQLQSKARTSVMQAFPNLQGMDIDAVAFLVVMQSSQDQQAELTQAMNQMQQNTQAKQAARQQNDLNQELQLRIQMEMDQMSKFEQALSNMMKSASDTQSSIIANLK
jgi:hypothetical protein